MLERGKLSRGIFEMVDTESLVPQTHLLRKIDAAVDFNRLYEMVAPLYPRDTPWAFSIKQTVKLNNVQHQLDKSEFA